MAPRPHPPKNTSMFARLFELLQESTTLTVSNALLIGLSSLTATIYCIGRALTGYALRSIWVENHTERQKRCWLWAGFALSIVVEQPAPGGDFEVRLKGVTLAKGLGHNVISRLRVGRMMFRSYKIRARSGFVTTFVVTDHLTRGYVADAEAILYGIVQWVDSCKIEDEYEWKTAFRNEMDRLHEGRSKEDRGRSRGWNRVHYPLPGYKEVRRRYLKDGKHADTFFEDWAWDVYSNDRDNLAKKFRSIIDLLPVLPRSTSGQPAPTVPKSRGLRSMTSPPPDTQA